MNSRRSAQPFKTLRSNLAITHGEPPHPRRTPADSQVDPLQSITSQFDRIRVCDPNRFPSFIELHGKKYKLILEKMDD